MRRPMPPRRRGFELNLTPLIDVVFNLVIFFLVASHFAGSEPDEGIQLPAASQRKEDPNARRLTITVQADGAYSIGTKQMSLEEVRSSIELEAGDRPAECAIRIRGDRTARYEFIEPIMLACARSGITNFGFKVIEPSETAD